MTIADKIAELPKFPDVSVHPADVMDREVLALSARLDLALEVLRNFLEHSDGCQTILSTDLPCTCGANDIRAVLAACGGESRE